MRTFELLLLFSVPVGIVWAARGRRWAPRTLRIAAVAAVLLMAVHLLTEGGRWQMVPAYVLAGLLALAALLDLRQPATREEAGPEPKPWRRRSRAALRWSVVALGAVLFLIAAALPALFPVDILPAPTGPHRIGTTVMHLTDSARPEPFTPAPTDARELTLTAWYPAGAEAEGRPTRLWGEPGLVARELAGGIGLPSFALSHLALTPAHARADVPAAQRGRPFPVLLFSHGYAQGFAGQNSALFEELASHGYVVLSIAHPYEGLVTRDRAGRLVRGDKAQTKRLSDEVGSIFPTIQRASAARDPAEADRLMREALSKTPVTDRSLALWAGDLRFVLDSLPVISARIPALRGALDGSRIGFVGMSFGAAAAVQACALDPRCDAAVNLDGAQFGDLVETGTTKPVLYLTSGSPVPGVNLPAFRRSGEGSAYASIEGATHLDFSDLALISPVFRWIGALGSIDGERMTAIERDTVRAFADAHVRGSKSFDPAGLAAIYPALRWSRKADPSS